MKWVERPIEVKPDDRELVLGTLDLPPSRDAEKGRFPNHHRVRQIRAAGDDQIVFRRIRSLPLRGLARGGEAMLLSRPMASFWPTAAKFLQRRPGRGDALGYDHRRASRELATDRSGGRRR